MTQRWSTRTMVVLGAVAVLVLVLGVSRLDPNVLGGSSDPTGETSAPTATPEPTQAAALSTMTTTPTPTVRPTVSPTGTPVTPTAETKDDSNFLLGLNYPWHSYGNDFGSNAWGSYGVHDPQTAAEVDADFARMAGMGVDSVRWFVFADGRAGIRFDDSGMPMGLDDAVFPDMDAALQIAAKHHISLNLVLLDFLFMYDARQENGVQMGGHANVINTPAGQAAVIEHVFVPLFQRYGSNPTILSWEVMNEPEWAIAQDSSVDEHISQPAELTDFRTFVKNVVDAIHQYTQSQATIGSASMKWVRQWTDLGLDYYQVHYYDWMAARSNDNLYDTPAGKLNVDKPVVVGEFPAADSDTADLKQYLDRWYDNGYAGAWAWSLNANDAAGTPDPATFKAWAIAHTARER